MNPYDHPHICEKESVIEALAELSPKQRRAVRSYVREVDCGSMGLMEWIADAPDSVSLASWRRPAAKGGNYWGTERDPVHPFRRAVAAYRAAWLRWQTDEESEAIRRAAHDIRMAATEAVTRLLELMRTADKDAVQLRAAESVLDRAGLETAEKHTTELTGETIDEWRRQRAEQREQARAAMTDFEDET